MISFSLLVNIQTLQISLSPNFLICRILRRTNLFARKISKTTVLSSAQEERENVRKTKKYRANAKPKAKGAVARPKAKVGVQAPPTICILSEFIYNIILDSLKIEDRELHSCLIFLWSTFL